MGNLMVIAIIGVIITAAIVKIVIEKKRGNKCIGCPHGHAHSKHKKKDGKGGCDC